LIFEPDEYSEGTAAMPAPEILQGGVNLIGD
jgi:hypothetical protein